MSNKITIQTFLRIRPVQNKFEGIKVDQQNNKITINTPKDENQEYINNQKQSVKFKFDQIFDMDAPQQQIFDKVAKDVADKAIEGFNGTIFAYGQTGSGKTYTMVGGGDMADGQGIIPRIIRHIYYIADVKGIQIRVIIRYLQIYNGVGYDMLDPKMDYYGFDKVKALQKLQKVKPMESGNGDLVLQNLSQHYANTHQDAMDLFIFGDINRITCKTPKNIESTSTHCIFMINLQTTKPGTAVKCISTINLVDLSSTQNIKRTQLQKNPFSNNKGLYYLERLVIELNKKLKGQKVHIPYRQSLMNMILKDSIGGNCITRMIATMSPKKQDVMETISTCRFAQRVALIKNEVHRNETVDPNFVIARLKRQNELMKNIIHEKSMQFVETKQKQNILIKNGQRKKSVNKTIIIKSLSRQNEKLKSILQEKLIQFPKEKKQTRLERKRQLQNIAEKSQIKKNKQREQPQNLIAIKFEADNKQILIKQKKDQNFHKEMMSKQQEREKITSTINSSLSATNIRDKKLHKNDKIRKK